MRRGDRQIDDDIELAVLEQFIGRLGGDAEFLGAQLGGFGADIRHRPHFETLEQRRQPQIGGRNIAGTHDADAIGLGHCQTP
ncbi:hypothetical protein D3C87_1457480 [compost metagenome]